MRRNVVLAVCCIGLFMVQLDNTIMNVALPSIARALHASLSSLQWTVDAYLMVLTSMLRLSGSLADRVQREQDPGVSWLRRRRSSLSKLHQLERRLAG